jgi:hypothetical protein
VTRKRAIAAGRKTYTGKPCKRGHGGEKYVSNWLCVECASDQSSARREAKPDERREYDRKWREANRDKRRAATKAWEEVCNIVRRMEAFLSISTDRKVLSGILVPDYDHYFWSNPIARENGRKVFGF